MTAFDAVSQDGSLPDDVSTDIQTVTRPGHAARHASEDPGLPSWYSTHDYRFGFSKPALRPQITGGAGSVS